MPAPSAGGVADDAGGLKRLQIVLHCCLHKLMPCHWPLQQHNEAIPPGLIEAGCSCGQILVKCWQPQTKSSNGQMAAEDPAILPAQAQGMPVAATAKNSNSARLD